MKVELAKHLWRSASVRNILRKEALRLAGYFVVSVGAVAISRYIREKPILEGVWSAAVGAIVVALMWLVSAVRTLRAVLGEHGVGEQ